MVEATKERRPTERLTTASERRFVLLGTIVAMVITSIPYVVGTILSDEERVFSGFVYAISDCTSYIAKMRQGAEGAWLFHIPYTPETHPGAVFFLFHRLLGKVAALLPGGNLTQKLIWVYHAARVAFGAGLLVTIYRFLALLTRRVEVRRLAWVLVTYGGGLGWLLVTLGKSNWLGSTPLDFILPEGFTFLVLFAFPHIALARTLLLTGLMALMEAWLPTTTDQPDSREAGRPGLARVAGSIQAPQWRAAGLAGLAWLLMGVVVPFYVAVAWAVMGSVWAVLCVRRRRVAWTEAALGFIAGLLSAPMVIYSVWRFSSHPVYAAWAAQNQVLSPHPAHYLAAYGLPLALGMAAVPEAWRAAWAAWLPVVWIAVVPFLAYVPFNLQRRLTEAIQVPLYLLAAEGLRRITCVEGDLPRLRWRLAALAVLLVLVPTNVMLLTRTTEALGDRPSPIYRDRAEATVLDQLAQRVNDNDVILGSYESGNTIPSRVGARVFVGHGAESYRAAEKRDEVARFFDGSTDDGWRRNLLKRYGVDYVFWGPEERTLGSFDPRAAPYLRQRHKQGAYAVFQVEL